MANYPKLHQTNAGRELIARANATGKAIKYVKISTGDGVLTNQNLDTLNSLIAPKLELPFTSPGKVIGNGQFQLEFALSNATVTNGFYAREIGVYAKLDGESDATAKLVAYTNGGNFVDYIPNKDTPINSKVFQIDVIIGNSENVIVQRVDAAYLTKGAMDAHNTSSSTHADIRRMFNSYLPLTGGTVTGRLYVNDAVFMGTETSQYGNFIERSKAGTMYLASGKSESSNLSWFNVDGYFKYTDTAEMCVIKRDENSNILARAFLLDQDNKTRFPNEVYSNEKLLATKEYVDAKGTNDLNAHNTSGGAHADIRTKITNDINTHNSSNSSHADIRRMFNNYLPLTGGTLTGNLNFTSTKGIMHPIGVGGGGTGANLNLGSAKTTSSTALCCINRPMWWDDNSARNLALEEDVNAHDSSSSAHADIRQMFTWKKLYSVNRDAFTMPASGTALCDIPSTWKELHITWIWRGDKSTINTVVGYEAYTINIVNEVTGDPIIFVAPGSEGYMTVKNNKLYVIHRGDSNDGAPVLVMWR